MGEPHEFNVYFDPHYDVLSPDCAFAADISLCNLYFQSPLFISGYVFDLCFNLIGYPHIYVEFPNGINIPSKSQYAFCIPCLLYFSTFDFHKMWRNFDPLSDRQLFQNNSAIWN